VTVAAIMNPTTGERLYDVEPSPDPGALMDRARDAQAAWAGLGAQGRGAKLVAAADRVASDSSLVDLIVSDVGKPITEARAEVGRAAAILRYAAGQAFAPAGELFEDVTGAHVRVLRFPRGVALLITPWNFPIAIPTWKIAPALQTGNAVVLKPASQALRIAQRLVDHLDLGEVVKVALGGAMGYAGQKCTATSLLFVHERAHDAVLTALREQVAGLPAGDPGADDTVVGPLIEAAQRDWVLDRIGGAEVLAGGDGHGHAFLGPTLIAGGHETDSEELFAPVLSVSPVAAMDDALERLGALPYGLVSGIVSPVRDEVEAFARRADTGIVRVNAPTAGVEPHVPFGGAKESSFGPREQGRAGFEFFTETRTIYG
jgi:aldehyde dehydrogenase (NAD+)